ncbi:MAG: hypothetical protein C0490_27025, partial [Marivirga sp.]|nr:hypothetical protein [Marivirga sp.]
MNLAPIVLFVYNRPQHTLKTLEALAKNDLANESILYVYADGPKEHGQNELTEEVERVVKGRLWCKELIFIKREINIGLAENISRGVTEVINRHGKIIVLEDDIVTSLYFLRYMNDALNVYEKEDRVMEVSAFMFPVKETLPETFFCCINLCWGWGTWKRAWDYFEKDETVLIKKFSSAEIRYKFNLDDSYNFFSQLWSNYTGR